MPADRCKPARTVSLLVRGQPGLLRDLVTRLAAASGLEVREAGEVDPKPLPRRLVQLLVEPEPSDWDAAGSCEGPIIVVSPKQSDEAVLGSILRGASSVLSQDISSEILLGAVTAARQGGTLLTPRQATLLAHRARAAGPGQPNGAIDRLTARESQILALIARGFSVKQTSIELDVSAKTVENLQSRLYRKLSVRNRAQAVRRAHVLGLLPEDVDS